MDMKKILLLFFCGFLFTTSNLIAQCGNLYIGGAIDGPLSGGTPKAIQVCASGNIADLSIYGMGSANNGGGTDGQEFTFPALSASAGDCFWISSNGGGHADAFNTWFGFAPCFTSSFANVNGDDAIELFCSGSLEDLLGDQSVDGNGECWEYLDGWAVNDSGAPNFGTFNCPDWSFSGPNALDGEGGETNATSATPYPSPMQACPAALPVELVRFSAKAVGGNIDLSWTTASEQNNDYFAIEYSTDGRNFTEIDRVKGAGTTNVEQQYTYTHKTPTKGINYYQLKQVDFDGTNATSNVEVVELSTVADIRIFPTKALNFITVDLAEATKADTQIDIFDIMGRLALSNNFAAETNQIQINISNLEKGYYFIRMELDGQMITKRFIKSN